jgi:CubicO group peptidase (beta-lactamase class C family)
MRRITRREFAATLAAATAKGQSRSIDDVLRNGIAQRRIPCVAAMVADSSKILYQGAFGKRDDATNVPVTIDSIFAIASMTKAVTTAAAMQLVEQGKITFEEPVERKLSALRGIQVLAGYDSAGAPKLRPPQRPVTLRHMLTHTSGLCYNIWNAELGKYLTRTKRSEPLMFDPGTRWEYGTGLDYTGYLVQALSGLRLEDYFQKNIFQPLGMSDTSYILPPEKLDRMVGFFRRRPNGSYTMDPRKQPNVPRVFVGGSGLFSTCADYVKFMQAILRRGKGILTERSVQLMSTNQTGDLRAGVLKTAIPGLSADVDLHPGASDRYTYGFLLNQDAYPGGRAAGSLAWAGIGNTFYWIDPKNDRCAVLMMQFLPFVHKEAVGLLGDFERAVYA